LTVENLVRALEVISVTPAFLKGYVQKWIYLRGALARQNEEFSSSRYMSETDSLLSGDSLTPAGHYTGVWCRDASFILTELLAMGKIEKVATWLEWIWEYQISQGRNVVHGRGSPELGFGIRRVPADYLKDFCGALPSSIQYSYSEVYGNGPDVDSTALMISVTCEFCIKTGKLVEELVPRIRDAIAALSRKDIDGDGLLEQGPNEDWMDTMLRSGKVVYSQGVWGAALDNWSRLLAKLGHSQESEVALQECKRVVAQVNSKLWDDAMLSYVDMPGEDLASMPNVGWHSQKRVAQDVSSFLLLEEKESPRALANLDTLKSSWTKIGPKCMSPSSDKTGPREFGPDKYQNGGIWPWISASEILARKRHGQNEARNMLLKTILPYSYVEWVDAEARCCGSYPFRTGVAAVRTAMRSCSSAS
jgi:glycogen debranching enzyme